MSNHSEQSPALSPTKLALQKIRELKQQIARLESDRHEDIAIVSMACRFPRQSNTPEAYWNSLIAGTDEIDEVPADKVVDYEAALHDFARANNQGDLDAINESGDYNDDIAAMLKGICDSFAEKGAY